MIFCLFFRNFLRIEVSDGILYPLPYYRSCFAGALLSFGGFLSFMITGNISAIRFGVIFGGALLALSVSSLRSWKKGESSLMALRGQTGYFLRTNYISHYTITFF